MDDAYDVRVSSQVTSFLAALDEKSERIVRDNLQGLSRPYPGRGHGDKKRITWRGEEVYRIHIGRMWTAFYEIRDGAKEVRVLKIMSIDQAHKEYGSLD